MIRQYLNTRGELLLVIRQYLNTRGGVVTGDKKVPKYSGELLLVIRQYLNSPGGVVTGDKTVPKYPEGVVTGGRAGTSSSLHKSLV